MTQPLLLVRGLARFFGNSGQVLRAVDGVSFALRKGEALGIIGEPGSGKSTTARMILGLIEPTAGELIFDGEFVGAGGLSLNDYRRQVQMAFPESYASLNPRLTVAETIGLAPRVHRLSRNVTEARVRELLDAVGLPPGRFVHCAPSDLTAAERQRVNIARVLALRPRLVILDDPAAGLDPVDTLAMFDLLRAVKMRFGLSYLVVSQNLDAMRHIADRVMVMHLGRVVEIGPAASVLTAPAHPYTMALLTGDTAPGATASGATASVPEAGCRYLPRCLHATAACANAVPELAKIALDHHAACFLAAPVPA